MCQFPILNYICCLIYQDFNPREGKIAVAKNDIPTDEAPDLAVQKLRQARDLLASCFDLLNDDITAQEWLGKLADLANCESVTCIWWRTGQPDTYLKDVFGREMDFSVDCFGSIDHLIDATRPQAACILGKSEVAASTLTDEADFSCMSSDRLITCIDWNPARVILILGDRLVSPNWDANDRLRINEILPVIRKSVLVKKKLSLYTDIIEISRKVDDEAARGLLTLLPNRDVLAANKQASDILEDGSIIRLKAHKIEFAKMELQAEFEFQLNRMATMTANHPENFYWYRNLGKSKASEDLLLTMRAVSLNSWHRESFLDDRTAIITLERMEYQEVPAVGQLREFYGLTDAQARFIREVMGSANIDEAASNLHISINTARSHLRAIYSKIGVNNMSQLMRRVSSINARVSKSAD
jgi:DNA-binding CsgD family transcriptional regulator